MGVAKIHESVSGAPWTGKSEFHEEMHQGSGMFQEVRPISGIWSWSSLDWTLQLS